MNVHHNCQRSGCDSFHDSSGDENKKSVLNALIILRDKYVWFCREHAPLVKREDGLTKDGFRHI